MKEALFVVALILLAAVGFTASALSREHRRVRSVPSAHPGGPLGHYELAYLAGGPLRTVNTALAVLARGGGVRVSRGGQVSLVTGAPLSPDPVERAVLAALRDRGGSCQVGQLRHAVADDQAMNDLRDGLTRAGLLIPEGALTRARRLLNLLLVLTILAFVFEFLAFIPILFGFLFGGSGAVGVVTLLTGSLAAVVGMTTYQIRKRALRGMLTDAGRAALEDVGRTHVRGVPRAAGLPLYAAVGIPVALYGLAEAGDPALTEELQRQHANSAVSCASGSCGGSSGSSGDGGSFGGGGDFGSGGWGDSGGGGGGSSCGGGGGCGGGGCGGG
ncbi:TIGR04222 domain-containing membrane protein [Streptosporangium sandarakinum]|uniref:TIGR04222 domain-containing membrane protein n=1 Tax=Streptosporangium sandarakinum TaxID=1260955 RepID=UPI0033AAE4E4